MKPSTLLGEAPESIAAKLNATACELAKSDDPKVRFMAMERQQPLIKLPAGSLEGHTDDDEAPPGWRVVAAQAEADDINLDDEYFGSRKDVKSGRQVKITERLGFGWVMGIHKLNAVRSITAPLSMAVTPYEHQLKAAAQAHWLCRSRFNGILLGDSSGLGKTLTAILAMYIVKDEPGFSVVVAPKALCRQWVESIEAAFQYGHGLTTCFLDDASPMTADELFRLDVDVVVASYDHVETGHREMQAVHERLGHYRKDKTGIVPCPELPNFALRSGYWRGIKQPIKRLVLDEVQLVNKLTDPRHKAVKALYYTATIQISGALAYIESYHVSGYLHFLGGNLSPTRKSPIRAFSTYGWLDPERTLLFQRLLQAFTIARPTGILQLPQCAYLRAEFHLGAISLREEIGRLVREVRENGDETPDRYGLSCLESAQLLSIHPRLLLKRFPSEKKAREEWLSTIPDTDIYHGSNRLRRFVAVYETLRATEPNRKMVVFSQHLEFLDLAAEALRRKFEFDPLQYDKMMTPDQRAKVQQAFEVADPKVPLLMTMTPGSFNPGPAITCASIVIQTEIWLNSNIEDQAIRRVCQGGQPKEVLYVQLFAVDSEVDKYILESRAQKETAISGIMEAVVRSPGREPDICELRPVLG